jgi:hypothetical protein
MRQFWSMRSNNWQQIAQTLRFEWPIKRGIIRAARKNGAGFSATVRSGRSRRRCQVPQLRDNPVYRIWCKPIAAIKEAFMAETVVKLRLNQQQLELMDRTIAQGIAPDRVSLVRLALREYAAARKAEAAR